MSDPSAIREDAPSPWWPCPECGGIHFRTTCVFERGRWADERTWKAFDPLDGHPGGIAVDVTCDTCGHEFNIAEHYDWPPALGSTEE